MESIAIQKIKFYIEENAKEHATSDYDLTKHSELPTLILRRGFNFFLSINFNRTLNEATDIVRLKFSFGPNPNVLDGTRAILPISPIRRELAKNQNMWSVSVSNMEETTVYLQIHIAANAPVGIWKCSLHTSIFGQHHQRYSHELEDNIYILFNPWCEDDGVYMPNENERKEYVLNEHGKIWCGTYKQPYGKRWNFGQFDDVVLPATVLLLDKSGLAPADRGSPVLVARAISAIINSADEYGLLEGKWDGSYKHGTSPHAWTGSIAIMEEYMKSGGSPVKYGQCWVFSGALVTVCRTLGIPCRPVTNYVSAHDSNCSLTVDKFFDVRGNKIEGGPGGNCNDSCWNFHVWNDVWMSRPDLPPGYGGWQIIDATPQELSDNMYKCGPASVEAVRKGEIGFLYDTPFVFSEVNADVVHFQEDPDSDWGFSRLTVDSYHVGKKIVTKRINTTTARGNSDLWDVTAFYKNTEGTEAERLAVYNAVKGVPKAQRFYDYPQTLAKDVVFKLMDIAAIEMGASFEVSVNIENTSTEQRTISAMLTASSVFYRGTSAHMIKKSEGTFVIKPGHKQVARLMVTPEEYLGKLVDHGLIKIYAIANVQETKQTWSEEDDFTLIKPKINVDVTDTCALNEDCVVQFGFQNPLPIPLTNCSYSLEIPGNPKPKKIEHEDIPPKQAVNITVTFKATRVGERFIIVNFTSKQIQGISGSKKITVV